MLRRLRRLLLLAILALVAGAAVLFLTTRPRLDDRKVAVSRAWTTALQPAVRKRADELALFEAQMVAAGPLRDPSRAVEDALRRWRGGGGLATQIGAANDLEGAGRRLVVLALDPNRRYHAIQPVISALNAYTTAGLTPTAVRTFNDAVKRYDDARRGRLFSIVADLLGDSSVPRLVTDS